MRSPSGPTRVVLQQLRASCVTVASHCDAITFDGRSNVSNSLGLLPAALELLIARAQQAIAALAQEDQP